MVKLKSENERGLFSTEPWECTHQGAHSAIGAYIEASAKWETLAIVQPTSGATAETIATYIVKLVNDNHKAHGILHDAMDALELCLSEANLTFSSEQAAERVVTRIKSRFTY